ncbi:sigma-54-dependent transcriptional regulator [Aureimonas pseudogalii]|uniref:DNA-binding transcriptional regulator NtrC n=1 Tax=Aureimonas pseudogalii TaxID=1744844 RepID=A0A7W6H7C7_9HYPH|nr:sigma-54 dependent transcriptional regulator [Aureimonas pseudogalii]MBB3999857.1 DNA-binding NtrC family response regulator [Aureimonas pseudogalii]
MRPKSEPEKAAAFTLFVVDDDPIQRRLVSAVAERMGARVVEAGSVGEAWQRLGEPAAAGFAVLVLDLLLPDGHGLDLLRRLQAAGSGLPVVVQTARAGLDTVVEAMRAGACDFLVKPASPARIAAAIEAARVLPFAEASTALPARPRASGAMGEALHLAERAARSAIPVLLFGETGTGKEWLARRIVEAGPRAGRPFVAVNCGALPRELAESLLFGHERGAFTGATQRQPGRFMEADGGTLFLDEVGDLAPEVQVKLLRALQEGEIDPVGAAQPVRTDVRIIAATHRDLEREVAEGRFREDLFYRLHVFPIRVPPLKDRRGEIAGLAEVFAARFSAGAKRLTPAARRHLEAADWPGNIRQLENSVHRAVVLSEGERLDLAAFGAAGPGEEREDEDDVAALGRSPLPPSEANGPAPGYRFSPVAADGRPMTLAEVERETIAAAIALHDGRLSAAARHLGIGRTTLYRKLRDGRIDGPD